MKSILLSVSLMIGLGLCPQACAPPVYVYDQLTVMEEAASGAYPLLRERMLKKSEAKGPLMLDPKQADAYASEKEKIFNVVDGEYLETSKP